MRLSGLKDLLHVYDTQDKGGFRRFKSSFFNIDRDEVSGVRQFIQELERDGRTSASIISYDAFEDYLSRNGKSGLISADYLKKDSKSTKIFKVWKAETARAIDFPPAPTSVSDKVKWDNNTSSGDPLTAREIFLGENIPAVNHYRLQVMNKVIEVDGRIEVVSLLSREPTKLDKNSISNNVKRSGLKQGLSYGEIDLRVSRAWTPLPGLCPYDKLAAFSCDHELELGYSEETDLYYLRLSEGDIQKVHIEYNLQKTQAYTFIKKLPTTEKAATFIRGILFQKDKSIELLNDISKEELVGALIDLFAEFKAVKFEKLDNLDNDYDRINAALQEKIGVCRHRALLFMLFADRLGLNARLPENDVHDFVEVNFDGKWRPIDLGGGESNLKIERLPRQNIKPNSLLLQEINLLEPSRLEYFSNLERLLIFSEGLPVSFSADNALLNVSRINFEDAFSSVLIESDNPIQLSQHLKKI